ncbi:hypothetical protein ELQ87_34775 [Streptomyces griseoviridis]|uniref:Uncharacterized protein n=1 Tax=Streptomyces griseoviridis TaxID=45398 RepID=A0A3Q9KTB6_STRGD|nr:hypothetical protein ELQ87_34775 [Streptomyces griseoviridis]QCN84331.1 hypothetical protein DDJ31_04490 [Streptomyces griseoviridis]
MTGSWWRGPPWCGAAWTTCREPRRGASGRRPPAAVPRRPPPEHRPNTPTDPDGMPPECRRKANGTQDGFRR